MKRREGLDAEDRRVLAIALERPATVARMLGALADVTRSRALSLQQRGLATVVRLGTPPEIRDRLLITEAGREAMGAG